MPTLVQHFIILKSKELELPAAPTMLPEYFSRKILRNQPKTLIKTKGSHLDQFDVNRHNLGILKKHLEL